MGRLGYFTWGEAQVVTEEWLAHNAKLLDGPEFVVEGSAGTVVQNGTPDMKWTKGDIMGWLDEKSVSYSSLSTKSKLLAKVTEYLEPTEDSMSNGDMDNTIGDE
tara:strand:- start:80 stop:391 length:312 start_codon:yes stop_codon:yes gene_type:complete